MQGWYLRRCMSVYNDIVRRPHLPREHPIRRIMADTGVDMTLYGSGSGENLEEEVEEYIDERPEGKTESESEEAEEAEEEAQVTDDECS